MQQPLAETQPKPETSQNGISAIFASEYLLGIMQHQTQRVPIAWWHSLMYAAGTLLIVCGIPATVILAFIFGKAFHLEMSETLFFGGCMVGVELFLGVVLSFIAERITKHQQTIEK